MDDPSSAQDTQPSRRRWLRRLAILYLVLLLLSHGVRLVRGRFVEPVPTDEQTAISVSELRIAKTEIEPTGRQIRLTYHQWSPPDSTSSGSRTTEPTVLLLHGSPGDGENFSSMGPRLASAGLRVLAPDLPGFGTSTQEVDDYSIRAHSGYALDLLDRLGIESVHVVGFSLGGGVALEMWRQDPGRLRSIALLSSVGVQELELLGQYGLNHAIHGIQLAFFQLIQEGVPHFGALDGSYMHLSYARNFFDSDQRPLRGLLERYDGPMLILHGKRDVLVPYAAAQEHHRIVPQSELVSFDANHFMVFRQPQRLVDALVDFISGVESGRATTRAEAAPDRVAEAEEGERFELPKAVGPTLMVWFLLLALATLVSEDLTCIAAGLLVARGSLGLSPAILACAVGIFVGDMGLYLGGRLGRPFLGRVPLRWMVKPDDLDRSRRWFDDKGPLVILLSRFLPGTRIPTYVSAGLLAMNPLRFALYLLVPVALWTPLLVGGSYLLGERFFSVFEEFQARALPYFLAFLIAIWFSLGLIRGLATWKGRRRWLGAWRRRTRWEFWPPWVFYPPVVLYIVWLALRYRSATLFTAANPGIPAGGGFIGESKSTILDRLGSRQVAPWRLLPKAGSGDGLEPRAAAVRAFVDEQAGGFPVVLKPDIGQRGSGVVIAKDEAAVEDFLESEDGEALVQVYVPGVELGIFWVRLPGEERGRIFSITDKRLPEVVGDGESSLERLILADERAVILADLYLAPFSDRLDEIPVAGERLRLVDLGTHCRGAIFLDGADHLTPHLESAVDEIARGFDGFYFGRFDFRAPSYECFRRGEDLQVLELNGVTSEATHIYDPRNRLSDAYRILFEQWRLAFEIGQRNKEAGCSPIGLQGLVRLLVEDRRRH